MKRDLFDRLRRAKAAKRPTALVTDLDSGRQLLLDGDERFGDLVLDSETLTAVTLRRRDDDSGRLADSSLFVQVLNPPLRLVVVGAVHIAQALVPMAALAGYDVTVVDPRRSWATDARFPEVHMLADWPDEALRDLAPDRRTAVVTLTHDPKLDDPALDEALRSEAFYIAALGSTRTHAKRLQRLERRGFSAEQMTRIHGPAGLAIGARSPAEIAVSVIAQMTAALHGAPPLVRSGTPADEGATVQGAA